MSSLARLAIAGIICASAVPFSNPLGAAPIPDFLLDNNQDGVINSKDLLILIRRWGLEGIATPTPTSTPTSTPTLTPTASPTSTPIPFPTDTFTPTPSPSPTETPTTTDTPSPTETPTNPDSLAVELPAPFIEMIRIPAGSFMMGSSDTERSRRANEGPVHEVTIDYDFYLGETEVTQWQWEAVMGSNPASVYGVGHDYPVYDVSWDDCQAFISALNALGQGTFRLPSEAEWEYACRAGSTTRFYFGDSLFCADSCENCDISKGTILIDRRADYMWFCGSIGRSSHPVRQLFGNSFGLYDMHGNVWEWCQDFYHADYTGAPTDGSAWESGGDGKVFRGGSWEIVASHNRSAIRFGSPLGNKDLTIGFRVAMTP